MLRRLEVISHPQIFIWRSSAISRAGSSAHYTFCDVYFLRTANIVVISFTPFHRLKLRCGLALNMRYLLRSIWVLDVLEPFVDPLAGHDATVDPSITARYGHVTYMWLHCHRDALLWLSSLGASTFGAIFRSRSCSLWTFLKCIGSSRLHAHLVIVEGPLERMNSLGDCTHLSNRRIDNAGVLEESFTGYEVSFGGFLWIMIFLINGVVAVLPEVL